MSRSGAAPGGLPLNLPGATQPTRYVGGTTLGAPTTGTFAADDFIIDLTGQVWICTTAGTPGTWQVAGAGTELAFAEITSNPNALGTTIADVTFGAGPALQITFPAPARPVELIAKCYSMQQGTAQGIPLIQITDTSNAIQDQGTAGTIAVNAFSPSFQARAVRRDLTAGTSYTFKVRAQTTGASATAIWNASQTTKGYLRALLA